MKFISSLILSCFICPLFGQNINTGSSFSGMANSCIMLSSPWAVFHNQAGIAEVSKYTFGISYLQKFHNEALTTCSLFVIIPSKWLVSSIDYQNYGYTKFYQEQLGLSFSKLLTKDLSLGVKIKYIHFHLQMYNLNHTDYNVDLGLQYKFKDILSFGAHISNPIVSKDESNDQLLRLGVAAFYTDLTFSIEYDKVLNYYDFFALGFNWLFSKDFAFKAGYNSIGNTEYMGVDYSFMNMHTSIAFSMHEVLGLSSQISLSYEM
jgi:hypothetical protein